MRVFLLMWLPLIPLMVLNGCNGGRSERRKASEEFARFVDQHFQSYFEWRPSAGTEAGFHEFDSKLEDYSAGAIRARIALLSQELLRLNALRRRPLGPEEQIDAAFLEGDLRSELLNLETLRTLHRNPMPYVTLPGSAVDTLIKRNFAPPAQRLRSVIARLRAVPALLESMRINVQDPPKEYTEFAIRLAEGSVGFLGDAVRGWGMQAAGDDAALRRELDEASAQAARAMSDAATWLKEDLLPRSHGSFAIGAGNFSRKLLYDEMIDIPLERLLALAEENLEKDRQAFLATAARIAPGKPPADVMRAISADHPSEKDLVEAARQQLESIRRFLVERRIAAIPSEVRPLVALTPPYARAGAFAMMDTPGAFETKATEAFYYLTPPEAGWSPQQKEEHLRLFNRPVMQMVSIHEVWPGHYLQFLYARQFPTKTRKLIYCGTNVEGWAHYAEQMMIEEGYGDGDPRIRLAQLSEALLRDCRFVAGIRMHTQGMSVEEAARLFMEKGFCERTVALEEARRGTYDPTYLVYCLGKLMIYKLRDDFRRTQGAAYSLENFHNTFLRQGGLPLPLLRKILLFGQNLPLL
ncbi:MAG: DUF885 domain-containing protein [Bryobacteraceae bacterium]